MDITIRNSLVLAFKKWSAHGLVPIIIGTILTFQSQLAMLAKSIAILVCALWLSLDIGIEIAEAKWITCRYWKTIAFCAITGLCFCLGLYIVQNLMQEMFSGQLAEVWQKLDASAYTPKSGDIFMSTFTVSNGGSTAIGANHQIFCAVNLIALIHQSGISGGGMGVRQTIPFEIRPGGDSQTDSCFQSSPGIEFIHGLPAECADVTVVIDYALVTQPGQGQQKAWRFVADQDDDFVWHKQALEMPVSPCQAYANRN